METSILEWLMQDDGRAPVLALVVFLLLTTRRQTEARESGTNSRTGCYADGEAPNGGD